MLAPTPLENLTPAEIQVTIPYTAALIRTMTRRVFWRSLWWLLLLAVIFGSIFVWQVMAGYGDWLVGVLGALFVVTLLAPYVLYRWRLAWALRVIQDLNPPEYRFHFREDGFQVHNLRGSLTVPWSAVKQLWRYPEAWILYYDQTYMTLPLAPLSESARRFVRERVQAHGGKIK
jgi:hypothetical protein